MGTADRAPLHVLQLCTSRSARHALHVTLGIVTLCTSRSASSALSLSVHRRTAPTGWPHGTLARPDASRHMLEAENMVQW